MLKLHNTLTGKKEEFKSIHRGKVGMYNCGPTVYARAHIGNLRAYVFADVLRRALELNGYEVNQVVNITDVGHLTSDADEGEDKMTKALKEAGKPLTLEAMHELGEHYKKEFLKDIEELNIGRPATLPHASAHVADQVEIVKGLEKKGLTYKTSDGIYFDTSKIEDYGQLGGLAPTDEERARVAQNVEKKNQRDFALWKFNKKIGWDSPWGKGFPGWHLECSAMSMKYLGDTLDIHTGGVDHVSTHHNNEIAQSENYTGKPLANYWLHHEHIKVDDSKMAKSLGNTYTLSDLKSRDFNPLSYRYWLLTSHYKSPVNFTWEALKGAQNALQKLKNRVLELDGKANVENPEYAQKFKDFVDNDLDTPSAVALVWELFGDTNVSDSDKKATLFEFDKVLGLGLENIKPISTPKAIQELVEEREKARKGKDWEEADKLRKEVEENGYTIKDTDEGPKINKRSSASSY